MTAISTNPRTVSSKQLVSYVVLLAVIWVGAYNLIQPFANWLSYTLLGLQHDSRLGESLAFFFYDVPKILLLLSGMVFVISIIRTFFSPGRTRALLGGKREGIGNLLGAMLGIVTPFCSCSAVPLFIGFVESGISLGVTFSFLIAAPVINEVAVVMLFGLFGWKVAGLYVATGLTVAVLAGFFMGRFNMERYVEDFVWQIKTGEGPNPDEILTWNERILRAWQSVKEIAGKVWLYVVVGIAVGAGIHGYVPEDALASILGRQAWWSVPAAVLLGVPLYSNAAGMISIVAVLIEKGAPLGTALAFMMSVIGLSLPEAVILRRVLKFPLLAMFFVTIATAIVLTGYFFNWIL